MRVIETSTSEDLSDFSRFLWQQRVRHRIYEESGTLIVDVTEPEDAVEVRHHYNQWRAGRLAIEPEPMLAPRPIAIGKWLNNNPVSAAIVILALVCYPITWGWPSPTSWVPWLTFSTPGGLLDETTLWQAWRWFTPALLHFGFLHLAFNLAIVWELGRRIEDQLATVAYLVVLLLLAVVSNWVQYLWTPGVVFGGLSGVAYGLLGFILMSARLRPRSQAWLLPPGLALSLLGFLVLFSTGVTTNFGLYIANAAHWGGLVAGLAAALVWQRIRP